MKVFERDGQAVEATDPAEWERWFQEREAEGLNTIADDKVGTSKVSTVFLGMVMGGGAYESMVYGSHEYVRRYETRAAAEAGHQEIVQRLRKGWGEE